MAEPQFRRSSSAASATRWLWWLTVLLCCSLSIPGCSGCWSQEDPLVAKKKQEEEEKRKKSEKKVEPFTALDLQIDPNEAKATANAVKPGHWITASQAFKANEADLPNGEFYSAAVDSQGVPLEADHTPFRLVFTRPAPLPKGQTKHFEFLYYIPRKFDSSATGTLLQNKLYARGGAREIFQPVSSAVNRMEAYQYHFLVLATDPDRYGYVKRLDSVKPIRESLNSNKSTDFYVVSLPKLENHTPLPSHPLAWTSLAYIVWDGIDPNLLTPEQQSGLIDWLQWGGQLIVSGPESLDTLRGSFLASYLPAEKVEALPLEQAAFAELSDYWSLKDHTGALRTLDLVEGQPPIGVELKLAGDSQFVPHTGRLVAEGRVGRGRIVVTAFSLTSRTLVNWASLDNFFNNALLRRPNRVYRELPTTEMVVDWAPYKGRLADPRLVSTLRYFSRDIGYPTSAAAAPVAATATAGRLQRPDGLLDDSSELLNLGPSVTNPENGDWHFDGYGYDAEGQSGVAGWNDFCAAADAARDALRDAAGISVPKARFILQVMSIYLLVLVPINWGVFRLLGRVEWAWIAAPIIAIVGAIAVVRLAQLDIGFARSQTEIAILELHNDHPRGHLTRFTALYSSLSTAYDFRFDEGTALAQPFPTKQRQAQPLYGRAEPTTCYIRRDDGFSLTNFVVRSNTTDFVHSEQVVGLGGALRLLGDDARGWSVENLTDYTIQDAAVLRRVNNTEYLAAYVGELAPKVTERLQWEPLSKNHLQPEAWRDSPVMSPAVAGSTEVSLNRLVVLATRQLQLDPGEFRLIGWLDQQLPGLQVTPQASQLTARTLVLAHLREAPLPPPESDENMPLTLRDPKVDPADDALNLLEGPSPAPPIPTN